MTGKRFLTVDETARELGTTSTRVLLMLRLRELFGVMRSGEWLVDARSVERRRTECWSPPPPATGGCGACAGCGGGGG